MGINLSKTKTINKVRKIENRISDFEEIVFGYSKEEAIEEASRCLQCKNPTCVLGCPASNNIPLFIKYIQEDKIEKAKEVLNLTSNMSEICSRVCDHNKQCEGKCIRGKNGDPVAIGLLERYVSEQNSHKNAAEPQYLGKKVAIIGSGPAGLSCAEELIKLGYDVVVFEQENENGGLLTYGIPNYRLPIEVVNKKITQLKSMKVNFINNRSLGKDFTIQTLKNDGFAAIFIAIGAQKPKYMGIKGETLYGLITSNDFLKYIAQISKNLKTNQNLLIGKKVAVIGGGNSAIDAARSALRLSQVDSVDIIYRRTKEDMPSSLNEINDAIEEGIKVHTLTNPIELIGESSIKGVKCVKMYQTELDSSGRRAVKPVENSEFIMDFDTVIYAIGNDADDVVKNIDGIELNKWNNILVNETFASKDPTIFAAGDIVTGSLTVVNAMASGKKAAHNIHEFLKNT